MTARPGLFLLEGREYDRDALLQRSRELSGDPSLPRWKKEVHRFLIDFLAGEEGIFQQTSGTTGAPKSVWLHRASMAESARRTNRYFGLRAGDPVLLCLPVTYVAGKMMVVRALVGRLDLRMSEPSGRPLAGGLPPVSFAAMVPLQVFETLRHRDAIERIETLLVGGGEIPPPLRDRLRILEKPAVYESFAMTETYSHIALRRINGKRPGTTFRFLEGVKAWTNREGCLVVEVPGVTSGPVVTGDMVEMEEDARSFKWLGRSDNLLKSGGIGIHPESLEEKISRLLGVSCLVLGEPDARLGTRLVLMVETGAERPDPGKWQVLLRSSLSPHELPRRIVPVEQIPRNANQKPDRRAAHRLLETDR